MPYLVLAFDYPPPEGPQRRQAAREEHLRKGEAYYREGKWLCAAALLDSSGHPVGSMIVCNFTSEEELRREWLDKEPYLVHRVWEKIQIFPIRPAPFMEI